jgi:hypothetical protein
MSNELVYPCFVCKRYLQPDDEVIQTVRIKMVRAVSGAELEQELVGEWFHASCWGEGVAPFRMIGRGPLSEVLERS